MKDLRNDIVEFVLLLAAAASVMFFMYLAYC